MTAENYSPERSRTANGVTITSARFRGPVKFVGATERPPPRIRVAHVPFDRRVDSRFSAGPPR